MSGMCDDRASAIRASRAGWAAIALCVVAACASQVEPPAPPDRPASRWLDAEAQAQATLDRLDPDTSSPDRFVRALSDRGFAQWMQGGDAKAMSIASFQAAIEIVDRDRPQTETKEQRLTRYSRLVASKGEPATPERLDKLVEAAARARFFVGEYAFERFAELKMPAFERSDHLEPAVEAWYARVHPEKAAELREVQEFLEPEDRQAVIGSIQFQYWVEHRFRSWLKLAQGVLERADYQYLKAFYEEWPEWQAASSARIGTLYSTMAHNLEAAPIDPSIDSDPELAKIYRDALEEAAAPYWEHAAVAEKRCREIEPHPRLSEWALSCELPFSRKNRAATSPAEPIESRSCSADDPFAAIDVTLAAEPLLVDPLPAARVRIVGGGELDVARCDWFRISQFYSSARDEAAGIDRVLVRNGVLDVIGTIRVEDLRLVTTREQTVSLGPAASLKVAPGVFVTRRADGRLQLNDRELIIEAVVPGEAVEVGPRYSPLPSSPEPSPNAVRGEKGRPHFYLRPNAKLRATPVGEPFAVVGATSKVEVLERPNQGQARVRLTTSDIVVEGWVSEAELSRTAPEYAATPWILDRLLGEPIGPPPDLLALPAGTLLRDRPAGCVVARVRVTISDTVAERRGEWVRLGDGMVCGVPLWVEDSTSGP